MLDIVDEKSYTAAQLRDWCRHLGIATSGTKSQLVLRLNEIPIESRGICPSGAECEAAAEQCEIQEANEVIRMGENIIKQTQIDVDSQMSDNLINILSENGGTDRTEQMIVNNGICRM